MTAVITDTTCVTYGRSNNFEAHSTVKWLSLLIYSQEIQLHFSAHGLRLCMVYAGLSNVQGDLKNVNTIVEIIHLQVLADCEALTYQQG
jgi:hypothetical protein